MSKKAFYVFGTALISQKYRHSFQPWENHKNSIVRQAAIVSKNNGYNCEDYPLEWDAATEEFIWNVKKGERNE